MSWKKWPYWVKGGIITGIFFLIIYFTPFLFYITPFSSIARLHIFLIYFLSNVINIEPGLNLLLVSAWVGLFLDFLIWILIGVLIGWIIGKIRKKKVR